MDIKVQSLVNHALVKSPVLLLLKCVKSVTLVKSPVLRRLLLEYLLARTQTEKKKKN